MSMYFPNRLELSFFRVLALPKACENHHGTLAHPRFFLPGGINERHQTSRTGLDMSILSLTVFSKVVLGQQMA